MRNLLLTTVLAVFAPWATAQLPIQRPSSSPVKPVTQKPVKQDPVKAETKQAAKKGDKKPADPKAGGPITDEASRKDGAKTGGKELSETRKPDTTAEKLGSETQVLGIDDKSIEELPAGADPADIAAMKSARAMLAAEKRLKKMLKEGKFKDIDRILTFEEIESWPYEDGLRGIPKAVKKLDGGKVMMTGFMLPIDEVEDIKEFLLVQSLWSCCYGQPPDINGIVRVVMKGKSRIDYQFDPIKIIGEFKVEACYEDGYCLDIYQLHADSVEAIK